MPILPNRLLRQRIRKDVFQRRLQLSIHQQASDSLRIAQRVTAHPRIQAATTIAVFISFAGELNTQPLIEQLWQQGKQLCLPTLHPFSRGHLLFLRYTAMTALIINRLKIPEPELDVQQVLPLAQIDVILTPMVAFDNHGQRLGMGAGFYDRTLKNWQQHGCYPMGLAYDCQQVDDCHAQIWDVPLAEVITPTKGWAWY